MRISEWMKADDLKDADVVAAFRKRKISVSADMVKRVRRGQRNFGSKKAAVVVELSRGRVSLAEALGLK